MSMGEPNISEPGAEPIDPITGTIGATCRICSIAPKDSQNARAYAAPFDALLEKSVGQRICFGRICMTIS
jgi:hypothetical protein